MCLWLIGDLSLIGWYAFLGFSKHPFGVVGLCDPIGMLYPVEIQMHGLNPAPVEDALLVQCAMAEVGGQLFAMYVARAPRHPRCRASRLLFALGFPDSSSPRTPRPTDGRRKHCGTSPLSTPAHALGLLSSIPLHVNGAAGSRITPLGSPPY